MRLLRLEKKTSTGQDTPRTKTKKLLRNWSTEKGEGSRAKRRLLKRQTKKALQFQFTLNQELLAKYKAMSKGKQCLSEIMRGKLIRKYKMLTEAVKQFGFTAGRQRKKRGSLSKRVNEIVRAFYERDDISRLTSGIKETVTKNGIKRQRRVMTDSIERIHEKFLLENTDVKISYSTFCRLRPFWVHQPKDSDRDTCACKLHGNMQFLLDSLHHLKCLPSKRLQEIVMMHTCSINQIDCMYDRCPKCKEVHLQTETDNTLETTWFQWTTKKEKRLIRNQEKEVTITVKERITGSIGLLIDTFCSEMQRFKVHTFNISNQLNHYRTIKENLKENEVLIHVDFAENFQCKLSTEIQSMHFGASKQQITLHTGVYYTKESSKTFCAASNCLDHNPSAIWAFLDPILDKLMKENKQIDTVHFFSDGPCSQYRQKGNFFLFSKEMARRELQATWNFHESGHGKGVPDGVGGALKRTANALVLRGTDITNVKTFIEAIEKRESLVMLYEVSKEAIAEKASLLASESLKAVPGTFKLHQIRTSCCGEIRFRDVSCTCIDSCQESGHNWKVAALVDDKRDKNGVKDKRKKKGKIPAEVGSGESKLVTESKIQNESSNSKNAVLQHKAEENVPTGTESRKTFFHQALDYLARCANFTDLHHLCVKLQTEIENHQFIIDYFYIPSIVNTGINVDEDALQICPEDIPMNEVLYPVKVGADGNCLPYTGSVMAFGDEKRAEEIRVRIIIELTIFKDSYLNQAYLQRGTEATYTNNALAKTYAFYSDEYANEILTEIQVERIYEQEIMKITKNKSYMGIWQIFSLSSVLCRSIFSVYPKLGNPNVRNDLHRLIQPRQDKATDTCFVMWTTTRKDMNQTNWVPNHFVAVLPIDKKKSEDVMGQAKTGHSEAGNAMHFELDKTNLNVTEKEYRRVQNMCTDNGTMQDKTEKQTVRDNNINEDQSGEKDVKPTEKDDEVFETEDEKIEVSEQEMSKANEKDRNDDNMNEKAAEHSHRESANDQRRVDLTDEENRRNETDDEVQEKLDTATVMTVDLKDILEFDPNNNEKQIVRDNYINEDQSGDKDVKQGEKDDKVFETTDENIEESEQEMSKAIAKNRNDDNMNEKDAKHRHRESAIDQRRVDLTNQENRRNETDDEAQEKLDTATVMTVDQEDILDFDPNDALPSDLVNKYVLVNYENKPYPGKVIDCDEEEVYVTCMHRLGRNLNTSTFYWPLAVKDECWYSMDKLVELIPEPKLVGQKYYVDVNLWERALKKLNEAKK